MPPSIDNETASDTNLTVIKDATLVIDCPVSGIPLPQITWYKDNELMTPDIGQNLNLYDGGRRLEILSALVSDAGNYRCVGSNDAGNTTKDFYVDVYGKIIIQTAPIN